MARPIDKAVDALAALGLERDLAYKAARAAIRAWLSDVPEATRELLPSITIPSATDISLAKEMAAYRLREQSDGTPSPQPVSWELFG